jgi:hypothetical protein
MSGQDYESPAPNHWLHQLLTLGVEKNIIICTKFVQNIKAILLCKSLNQIWAKQTKSTFNAYCKSSSSAIGWSNFQQTDLQINCIQAL